MNVWLFLLSALGAYLIGSINPAIILSRKLYQTDIRRHGSHNPGFTNFKRIFGGYNAYLVFLGDFMKSLILCVVIGKLFQNALGFFHLGAAWACLFAILGHAFPLWYGFHGGKGVAIFAAAIWFIDWRAGLVAAALLAALLAVKRYMSLAVLCAIAGGWLTLCLLGAEHWGVLALTGAAGLFIAWRHRENIGRLRRGTESKFSLRD